jgi:hypothetical protein
MRGSGFGIQDSGRKDSLRDWFAVVATTIFIRGDVHRNAPEFLRIPLQAIDTIALEPFVDLGYSFLEACVNSQL